MDTLGSSFEAIGTDWDIQIQQPLESKAWEKLLARVHHRIESFDKSYSRFRNDSLVTKMSRQPGTYGLPSDGHKMLTFYERLYRITNGAVTPLIGQTMADAGYDANYSLAKKTLQEPGEWDEIITYDEHHITLKQPAMLDFGAAGKGYLVDIVSGLIADAGVTSYLINAGGDILHRSAQNQLLEIALENPFDTSEAIGIAQLSNHSICASAGSKRRWQGFHHIIDPRTLSSPEEIAATWVVADDTMVADGIATALFFTSAHELQKVFNFSYAILHQDMSLERSKGFPATLFAMEPTY